MSIDSRAAEYGKKFGDWILHEMIGKGSNGRTAVFRMTRNNRTYEDTGALKVVNIVEQRGRKDELSESYLKDYEKYCEELCEKAENELNLMNMLGVSGNIVNYHDHRFEEWEDDYSFGIDLLIRMDLLESLDKLKKKKTLCEQKIIQIGIDISNALICCHSNGILHRDIKPDNIFYNEYNYLLGDFGISKMMANYSTAETRTGTEAYAAPEQFLGHYDHRVDIYSLGLTMYELANGNKLPFAKTPFAGPEEIQLRLNGTALPKPEGVGDALAEVILKACSHNPEERYHTAAEMNAALEKLAVDADGENPENKEIQETEKSEVSRCENVEQKKERRVLPEKQPNVIIGNTAENERRNQNLYQEQVRDDNIIFTNENMQNPKQREESKKNGKQKSASLKKVFITVVICCVVLSSLGIFLYVRLRSVPKLETSTMEAVSNGQTSIEQMETDELAVTSELAATDVPEVTEPEKVSVPNLLGLTETEAEKLCQESGLALQVSEEYSDITKKGAVISQKPKAVTETDSGSKVKVVISKGIQKVIVPNVIDYKEDKAKDILKKKGLKYKIEKEYSSSIGSGKVMKQSIAKGTKVKKDTVVKVTVSKGKKKNVPAANYNTPVPIKTSTPTRKPVFVKTPTPTRKPISVKTPTPKKKEKPKTKKKNSEEDDVTEWDMVN